MKKATGFNRFLNAFSPPVLVITCATIIYAILYPDQPIIEIFSSRAILTALLAGFIILWPNISEISGETMKSVFKLLTPIFILSTILFLIRGPFFSVNLTLSLAYTFFSTYIGIDTMTSDGDKDDTDKPK